MLHNFFDRRSLAQFLSQTEQKAASEEYAYLYSNDLNLSSVIRTVLEQETSADTQENIALFVGSGAMLSLLPRIPESTIIVLDIDARLIAHLKKTIELILAANTRDEFTLALVGSDSKLPLELIEEMLSVGAYHFLANDANFQNTRAALRQKKVLFGQIDLSHESSMKTLGQKIQATGKHISFANITNVLEYSGSLNKAPILRSLKQLPFTPDARIMHATKDRNYRRALMPEVNLPIARLDIGLANVEKFTDSVIF